VPSWARPSRSKTGQRPELSATKAAEVRDAFARLRQNDLLLHGAIVFIGLGVANVFNYLYYMLAGRVLGVEAYGELTSLTSALLTLAAPANVAQIIVARLTADLSASGSHSALKRLSRATMSVTWAVTLLVVAAGVLFRDPIAAFFHSTPLPAITTIAALGAYLIITVQRGILQGSHRFGALSGSYVIEGLVRLVVGIPLAVGHGAFGGLMGAAIGGVASVAYNLWALRFVTRRTGGPIGFDLKRIMHITAHIGVAQFTLTALSFYDVALVRHVFDARSAGLYAAAALVGRAMGGMLQFVPTIIMPKATARTSTGASALPLLGAGIGLSASLAGLVALIAALAPAGLAAVFAGNAFRGAAPLVLPYVLAAAALGIANVIAAYQIGLHRYWFVVPSTIVAIVEVTINMLWHPSTLIFVAVLLGGHAAFLASTFIGVGGTQRQDRPQHLLRRGAQQP